MNDPYNTADRFMPRDYAPKPTVTFKLHHEMRSDLMPMQITQWAESSLPDGDYVAQYHIAVDKWSFGRAEWEGGRCRIVVMPQEYP